MERPIISVIVPIYNTADFLEKCINSVLAQTYSNIQIILVDDGSTDGSGKICDEFARQDNRIEVVHKKNGGLIRARKTGVEIAKGELIGFVDSDDWIEKDMYETMFSHYKKYDCDVVSVGYIQEKSDGSKIIYRDGMPEGFYDKLDEDFFSELLYIKNSDLFGVLWTLATKLFKKELLKEVYNDINEDITNGEDGLTFWSYCLLASNIYIEYKPFYHYLYRSDSMCHDINEKLYYNNYMLYNEIKKKFMGTKYQYVMLRQVQRLVLEWERQIFSSIYKIDMDAYGSWIFDYSDELFARRFILYGAGACGQALHKQLSDKDLLKNMVAWVDKAGKEKEEYCGYEVFSPDIIAHLEWDSIIIAVENEELAGKIIEELNRKYDIDSSKVIWKKVKHIPLFSK